MDHPDKTAYPLKAPSPGIGPHQRWIVPTLLREQDGGIAVITALALTMLIGLVGLAIDAGM